MIALSFALPEESKGIVRLLAGAERTGPAALPILHGHLGGVRVAIVHAGMGRGSAAARLQAFLRENEPRLLLAAGFGGALLPELRVGDLVAAPNFSDARLLVAAARAGASSAGYRTAPLVTASGVVETAAAKAQLARASGAAVVDMETEEIHRLCVAHGIPMLAVRAISDTADQDLPVPARVWFDAAAQRPRPAALAAYLAAHPGRIVPFARFVSGVGRAGTRLTAFISALVPLLAEQGSA